VTRLSASMYSLSALTFPPTRALSSCALLSRFLISRPFRGSSESRSRSSAETSNLSCPKCSKKLCQTCLRAWASRSWYGRNRSTRDWKAWSMRAKRLVVRKRMPW
jgi:hypothetical protein